MSPPPVHHKEPDMPEELLLGDAFVGVWNALDEGWSETDEYTIEKRDNNTLEIDLPATHQTVRITIDIGPST
jgi:hypothetical protein